jgi:ubiquinone/menaquinone biosynthesis C-methylase UbiE
VADPLITAAEADRIRAEYERRERVIDADFYSLTRPANLFAHQQRARALLDSLRRERLLPLDEHRILDVGCGEGLQLLAFEQWGAAAKHLAGIDLLETRIARAARRFGGPERGDRPDLRTGDASVLPWPDDTFDILHQATVFTSIQDASMKRAMAGEMLRVLKPGGVLLWYDFFVDNPANPHVTGIPAGDIRRLFSPCAVRLRRVTLAPPVARRLVPITWLGALMLEKLAILNTHYLAVIRKPWGTR